MGIIYLLIGGVIGYLVTEKVTVKNWGMKLCHAFLIPLVINIVVTLLLVLITGNSYLAGAMTFPVVIASIAYFVMVLVKMKIHKEEYTNEDIMEISGKNHQSIRREFESNGVKIIPPLVEDGTTSKQEDQYKKNIEKVEREMRQSAKKVLKVIPGVLALVAFLSIAGYSVYKQMTGKTIEALHYNGTLFNGMHMYHASTGCEDFKQFNDHKVITNKRDIYNNLNPLVSPNNIFCKKCLPKELREKFIEYYEE